MPLLYDVLNYFRKICYRVLSNFNGKLYDIYTSYRYSRMLKSRSLRRWRVRRSFENYAIFSRIACIRDS